MSAAFGYMQQLTNLIWLSVLESQLDIVERKKDRNEMKRLYNELDSGKVYLYEISKASKT